MLFNSAAFVVFLFLSLGIYWLTPWNGVRQWFLILASLVFYGWWDYRFVPLLVYVTLIGYFSAQALTRWPTQRKRIVSGAITLQLLQLAFFKYTNFLLDSAHDLLRAIGIAARPHHFSILLPIGVSFYTFHGISYLVDVYRGKLDKAQSLRTVALYIVFFPQLVAGPIVRADAFIPQLSSRRVLQSRDVQVGIKFILIGMIYKGVFADQLGPLVDKIFKSPAAYNNITLISAAFGFYSQIYFDFVGYSTMAIGISRLFGFKLPKNFDFPYRSTSVTEFWRSWHISLSSWLRDYLYIPLGGNRVGVWKQYRNLLLTMLLGGLWHGASYNFILWGGLHGLALAIHKLFVTRFPEVQRGPIAALRGTLGWLITQLFVLLAWVPFRAETFHDTGIVLRALCWQRADEHLKSAALPLSLLLLPIVADHLLTYNPHLAKLRWPVRPLLVTALLGLCLGLAFPLLQIKVQNFIYFQF